MKKIICPHCGRVLFFARTGEIQIKCPRCKCIVNFDIGEESVKHTVKRE